MLDAWPRSAWSSVPTDAKTASETGARECHVLRLLSRRVELLLDLGGHGRAESPHGAEHAAVLAGRVVLRGLAAPSPA